VSVRIAPGEVVGVVGATGAGKSTLISLLMRCYDPEQGAIRFNGTDVRDCTLASVRGAIGTVLQKPILFPATVAQNIAYGKPDASLDAIRDAAVAARADEFISQLPDHYDTLVGERGSTLSGGQRQRLCIARALLLEHPILVLDEPTSALDDESETELLAGLRALLPGRTTFLVTHRWTTLQLASRVLVVAGGRIVEDGTIAELLSTGTEFKRLFASQLSPEARP
jgi:ATP-binding cassette, subfamily B, bacterial